MRRKTISVVAAVAVIAAVAAGIAVASIPDGSGNVHACYKRDTGVLRAIDTGIAGETCKAVSEAAVQWNVIPPVGPVGLQGPPGPKGVQGPKGPQGPHGTNEVTYDPKTMMVSTVIAADPQVGGFFVSLTCPQGMKALFGEWVNFLSGLSGPQPLGESFPISDDEWGFAMMASKQSIGIAELVKLRCAIVN